ncbi:carbamate kinase, partial [Staphylococcus aureus]|nr:carbamate kinase [Staphylococcus aureus]
MIEKIVIALGGNAIHTKEATAEAQQTAIIRSMQNLKQLCDSTSLIVISQGNGTQIV